MVGNVKVIHIQWNLWIPDTYTGLRKSVRYLEGVHYSEVNLEGFHRIGSQIVCPLLGGVRYSACPLFRGFTVQGLKLNLFSLDELINVRGVFIARNKPNRLIFIYYFYFLLLLFMFLAVYVAKQLTINFSLIFRPFYFHSTPPLLPPPPPPHPTILYTLLI